MEGEGCVRINQSGAYRHDYGCLVVEVSNTDKQMLNWLQANWPGHIRKRKSERNCRPAWSWSIWSKKASSFLKDIQGYCVTDRMNRRISLALEFQEQKSDGMGGRFNPNNQKRIDYSKRQKRFIAKMHKLNQRGPA